MLDVVASFVIALVVAVCAAAYISGAFEDRGGTDRSVPAADPFEVGR